MNRRSGAVATLLVAFAGLLAGLAPAGASPTGTATGGVTPVSARQAAAGSVPTQREPVGAGNLSVRIDSITPSVPTDSSTIRLTGTISNPSQTNVTAVVAQLRVSATPLPNRSEIPEVLAGQGQRVGEPVQGASARVEVSEILSPGQSAPFSVSAPASDLPFGAAGAYVIGVEALGNAGSWSARQDLDRTFVPWWPEDTDAQHLQLTTLWPLVGAPLRDAQGVLLTDDPAVELSPGGRLQTLLAAAVEKPGVASVIFDPQVIEAAKSMSAGYLIADGKQTTTGTRSKEVARWLDQARTLAGNPEQDVHATIYAMPDVVAAREGKALSALLRQREFVDAETRSALGTEVDSDVVLIPGGVADRSTLDALTDQDPGALVMADTAMPAVPSTFYTAPGRTTWTSADGKVAPVLLTDTQLGSTLAMPMNSAAERVAARQRLLAETLVTVTELPNRARLLVAAPDAGWSPTAEGAAMVLDTLGNAPWIQPETLPTALAWSTDGLDHQLAAYPESAAEAQLPAEKVAQARQQARSVASYARALTNPEALPAVTRTAPSRTLSSYFRGRPDELDDLADRISDQLADLQRSVRVVSSGPVTVAGNSGTIPVTVENLGTEAVTVGLTLTATPAQVFTAEQIPPFRIDPGRRTSVEVRAEVNAAGPIPVTIQPTTTEGAPFGVPGELTVTSSAYARSAQILVQVSLALLLVMVVVHGIRRVRRSRAAREAEPDRESA